METGRHENYHKPNWNRDGKHEGKGANDGHNSRKELGEALEEAVAHLVGIVHHAREKVAVRMGIDKRERQVAKPPKGINAQVSNGLVGEPVRAIAGEPLGHSCPHNNEGKLLEQWHERREVYASCGDHAVDTAPNNNRHVELEYDRDGRGHKGGDK
jgi:hypothetical protein